MGRFVSADTIVPDPMNPQQFNRYTYGLNNPVRLTDPTGHCAQDDADCWGYLENQFCNDVDCGNRTWQRWLVHRHYIKDGKSLIYFDNPWTKTELEHLSRAMQSAFDALANIDINWRDTPLADFRFQRGGPSGGMTFSRTISFSGSLSDYLILHEMEHGIDAGFGKELHDYYDEISGNCADGWFCNAYAAEGYYYTDYGRAANHSTLGRVYGVFARQGEAWADAFAAWVSPSAAQGKVNIDDPSKIKWNQMNDAVTVSLEKRFK